jgi:2-polyprenyl-6-methoxyphenol hydroxylase-like FAD-dependent oxidoreductase
MRCARDEPVGAALALAPDGLRALDVIGAQDALRALAVPQEPGIRRSDGRWLIRSTTGQMVSDRFHHGGRPRPLYGWQPTPAARPHI